MAPRLFEVLGFSLPSYFVFVVLAFAVGVWIARRWAITNGMDSAVVADLGLFSLVFGILGARMFHVLFDGHLLDYVHLCIEPSNVDWRVDQHLCVGYGGSWDAAQSVCHPKAADCLRPFKFWSGGLTLYGGVFASLPFAVWFLRREGFPVLRTLDFLSLLAIGGIAVGRVGCFLGGCCFGSTTEAWFGVSFPPGSPASLSQWRDGALSSLSLPSRSVHPTQLYEAGSALVLVTVLAWAYRRKPAEGSILLSAAAGYAVVRFVIEFARADERGGFGPLSTSQWLGIAVVLAVLVLARKTVRSAPLC